MMRLLGLAREIRENRNIVLVDTTLKSIHTAEVISKLLGGMEAIFLWDSH